MRSVEVTDPGRHSVLREGEKSETCACLRGGSHSADRRPSFWLFPCRKQSSTRCVRQSDKHMAARTHMEISMAHSRYIASIGGDEAVGYQCTFEHSSIIPLLTTSAYLGTLTGATISHRCIYSFDQAYNTNQIPVCGIQSCTTQEAT